ncbi:MAG: hypothetical protein ACRD68_01435 [Pyrinomonadaceae bacterium]
MKTRWACRARRIDLSVHKLYGLTPGKMVIVEVRGAGRAGIARGSVTFMSATEDLIVAIRELPLAEQRRLLAALEENIRRQTRPDERRVPIPVSEIRGIAKPDGRPPNDEEIGEGYTQYLLEKYS